MSVPHLSAVKLELARRKLLRFTKHTMRSYKENWHHVSICKQLDDFVDGKIKDLMIFVPPQHGKSELSSRKTPPLALGKRPDLRICLASYSDTLANSFLAAAKLTMESEEYAQLFPDTVIAPKGTPGKVNTAKYFQLLNSMGSLRAVGIGLPLTGQTVDMGIIDDPFKDRLEAESEVMRERVWNWYTDVFKTRLHNKSQQLLLMTRWHPDDLAGKLLKEDDERELRGEKRKWTVITYRAVKEAEDDTPDDPREVGEALWEEMHSITTHREQERSNKRTYNSLYQQRPTIPGGNILQGKWFEVITLQEWEKRTQGANLVPLYYADTAYTEKTTNDPTALGCFYLHNGIMAIRKVTSVRMELPALCKYIPQFHEQTGGKRLSKWKVEAKASGLSVVQTLKYTTKLNISNYRFPPVDGVTMHDKDKTVRANAAAVPLEAGRVTLIDDGSGWVATFVQQCEAFPNGTHDDEVDVFSMAAIELLLSKQRKGMKKK